MKKGRGTLSIKKSVCSVLQENNTNLVIMREKDILHHLRPDQTIREHVLIQLSNNVQGTNVAV